jgi:hypothetical protein
MFDDLQDISKISQISFTEIAPQDLFENGWFGLFM